MRSRPWAPSASEARWPCSICKSRRRDRRPSLIRAAELHRAQDPHAGRRRSSQMLLPTCVRCKDATPRDQPATVLASFASVGRLLASTARNGRNLARNGPVVREGPVARQGRVARRGPVARSPTDREEASGDARHPLAWSAGLSAGSYLAGLPRSPWRNPPFARSEATLARISSARSWVSLPAFTATSRSALTAAVTASVTV